MRCLHLAQQCRFVVVAKEGLICCRVVHLARVEIAEDGCTGIVDFGAARTETRSRVMMDSARDARAASSCTCGTAGVG